MPMIEPTGSASQVLQTPAPRVETEAQQSNEIQRPVEEAQQTEAGQNPPTSQATESDSTLGRFVDTTA